jgi:hypothetical protein
MRRLIASIVTWLIGLLFFGLGCWILLLRFEGLADRIKPHNMSIGQITIDGDDSKGYAELLRARFDHHFRRPISITKETGFLEVVSLDTPDLFQPKLIEAGLKKMTIEVSGVDVTKLIQIVNQLFKPDQWVVEGDFQSHSDRMLFVLRLRRGERLIRTWYLDRLGNPKDNKSKILEQLIDDAIFQLVYDFGNKAEKDKDLSKWRNVIPAPTNFPNRLSVAAYYEALGALGRYYAHGNWKDLDRSIKCLQILRTQMPKYEDGLQLLGMALTEKRNEIEAIHVYEQLQLLWKEEDWKKLTSQKKCRIFSIDLLKASATAKLYTWQSAHESIAELSILYEKLQTEKKNAFDEKELTTYSELLAHTAIQLSYTYALYLSYMRSYTVSEIFGNHLAPNKIQLTEHEIGILKSGPPNKSKPIVIRIIKDIVNLHEYWKKIAKKIEKELELKWLHLTGGERRRSELKFRIHLVSGFANYRIAELENNTVNKNETICGVTFQSRIEDAEKELRGADVLHPNHYLVLQFLGLVYSEPRRKGQLSDLSIAEQYFERAISANQSDYYGHELLANILLRRVANRVLDLTVLPLINKGIESAMKATVQREMSGNSYLLQANFYTMLLTIEKDIKKRQELRKNIKQYMDQSLRFLPQAFGKKDPMLSWLSIIFDILQLLSEKTEIIKTTQSKLDGDKQKTLDLVEQKENVISKLNDLINYCKKLEERWIAHQRVFHIRNLKKKAEKLLFEIKDKNIMQWHEVKISFYW